MNNYTFFHKKLRIEVSPPVSKNFPLIEGYKFLASFLGLLGNFRINLKENVPTFFISNRKSFFENFGKDFSQFLNFSNLEGVVS